MTPDTKIRIERHERSAKITYTDGAGRAHVFDAELGGNDVLLCIYAPAPADWAVHTPWPVDERGTVLEDMARKVARREGFGSYVRLSTTGVEIYKPTPWWRRLWR
jgi:hypothetical protein